MKKVLEKINELVESGILEKYAIGGGIGQLYYIRTTLTEDLDLLVHIGGEEAQTLAPLSKIYEWADKNNYIPDREHIIIESIPVQFIVADDALLKEALDEASEVEIFDVKSFVLRAEYLMAIMLKTGRSKDKLRLEIFFEEAEYSAEKLLGILDKFNLREKYDEFRSKE